MSETCRQFVERIWGREVTEEEMNGLLWHCTAFPAAEAEHVEKQLVKAREKSGGSYDLAMEQADNEISEAMSGLPERTGG